MVPGPHFENVLCKPCRFNECHIAPYPHTEFQLRKNTDKICPPHPTIPPIYLAMGSSQETTTICEAVSIWVSATPSATHKTPCHSSSSTTLNSLGPSDPIWRHRSGSTLVQVMACCLTAPSHYLNQCWLIITKVQGHSSDGSFTRDAPTINHWN